MGNEFSGRAEHSAEYFGDTRDHWWNRDYLALLATRWRFSEVRDALDVGCGVGHWGQLLAEHLPADARVTGVDREVSWVAAAAERATARGLGGRYRYVQGTAEALPFPDTSFDLVTCQTVLIHVPDPRAVLAEMVRVLRPGGLVAVCEPNNLTNALMSDATTFDGPLEELLEMVRFQAVCERGKVALGEGNNSIGQLLPAMFAEAGLRGVTVSMNDRANPLVAPYAEPWARAALDEIEDTAARELAIWDEATTLRYYRAGGGCDVDFARAWTLALRGVRRAADEVRAGTYRLAGGTVGYCVAGRRPKG